MRSIARHLILLLVFGGLVTFLSIEMHGCENSITSGFPYTFYWEEYGENMEERWEVNLLAIDVIVTSILMMIVLSGSHLIKRIQKTG